jgi:osmoprotectant transport system permease protein
LVQTLPSLALFGLLILPLAAVGVGGIGQAPALVALSLYAAFPIARSTLTALENLDPAVLDSARGLGMGRGQLFLRVQVPLALPVVLEGVRTASIQTIGNTVVAALIGAGGLGSLVFFGLGQFAPDLILLGALPVMVLALGLDMLWSVALGYLNRRVRS